MKNMRIRHILAVAAIAFGGVFALAQGSAFVGRAAQMLLVDNALGAIDQSAYALQLPLEASEAEKAEFIRATATISTNPQRALGLLQDFVDSHPASPMLPDAIMAMGDCFYGPNGSWHSACRYYEQVLPDALDPSKAELLLYRHAYCLLMLGKTQQAAPLFKRLERSSRFGDAARFYSAYALYEKGDYAAALPAMEKARTPMPPGSMADFYLAQMYCLKADYHRALACANLMLKNADADPAFRAEALRVAGECQYRLGNRSEARKLLGQYRALAADPLPSALYILGLFEYEDGNYDSAVELLTPATEGGDAMAQSAYLLIGQARLEQEDYDAAAMALSRALNLDFDPEVQEAAFYNYGVASLRGGKVPFGNAVSIFRNFLDKYPSSPRAPQVQQFIISEYLSRRDYAKALECIDAMANPTAETEQARQRALYMLGAQHLANAQTSQAIKALSQAASLRRLNPEVARQASLLLGEAYYADAQFAKAAEALKSYVSSASASDANLPLANFDLGYAYLALGKFAEADAAFSRYLSSDAASSGGRIAADACLRLADANYARNNYSRADEYYTRAMELSKPVGDYALMQQALMQGYQRRYSQKIELLERLQSAYPSSPLVPRALLEEAQSRIQMSDNSGAIATYRALVKRYPASAQAREGALQMALALANSGNAAQAKDAYKAVVSAYPQSDEAAQAIEALKRLSAADGSVDELRQFLASAGSGHLFNADEADALTFEAAEKEYLENGGDATLKRYVQEYPDGAFRAQAIEYLAEVAQKESDAGKGNLALASWRFIIDNSRPHEVPAAAWLGLARCGLAVENYAEAAEGAALAADASVLTADERTEARYILGLCLDKQGQARTAAAQWTEAANNPSAYYGMAAAVALAQQALDSGNLDSAEELARAAADADTPHAYWVAKAFLVLSDVYAAKGDAFKARQYVKSLRDNYPGSEPDIISEINSRLK